MEAKKRVPLKASASFMDGGNDLHNHPWAFVTGNPTYAYDEEE
ncbi:hypothetical protein ACJA3J_10610 [Halobacillus sp. SY10]|nr:MULTISPECIES: hypothetical protein [Halobacillus]